jgi:hypothetical protein
MLIVLKAGIQGLLRKPERVKPRGKLERIM